jgi:hypothetical protein
VGAAAREALDTHPLAPTPTAAPARPANDLCTAATLISSVSYATSIVTSAATIDVSDPTPRCGNGSRNKSVWYRFTAPTSGTVKANTFGSKYDTILSTYTGLCGSLASLSGGCNDNASGTQSQVAFAASAGRTYHFMVSASTNVGGGLALNLTFQAAAPPVPTPTRVAASTLPTPTPALPSR